MVQNELLGFALNTRKIKRFLKLASETHDWLYFLKVFKSPKTNNPLTYLLFKLKTRLTSLESITILCSI